MAKIKSLSEQVYDYIVYKIKIGELLFDEKINETDLIDQLGISRTPIREALIQMSSDGILENIPRKGFFVKSISNQKISEVYKIIGVLDAYAIKLAMPNITKEHLRRLSAAIEKIDLAIEKKNYELYCNWQEEFHLIYLEACGNNSLVEIIQSIERKNIRTTFYSESLDKLFIVLAKVNDEHRAILKSIEEKDSEKAAELLNKHWGANFPDVV